MVDLLAGHRRQGGPPPPVSVRLAPGLVLEHTAVRIDSLADADAVAAYARGRSVNWGECAPPGGLVAALPNRGHAFARVLVHNRDRGWMALLHIVDLVGASARPRPPTPVLGRSNALLGVCSEIHPVQSALFYKVRPDDPTLPVAAASFHSAPSTVHLVYSVAGLSHRCLLNELCVIQLNGTCG